MSTSPVSVLILTSTPPENVGATAALTENLGFGQVWVAEDYFFQGGFTAAAAALQATRDIPVGLGIVAASVRHAAVTAMEIASLGRTYPGRFIAGIGHGASIWTDQMGLTSARPLTTLEECVNGVRTLLNGDTLDYQGRDFTFESVALAHPPTTEVPLVTGVVGPRSLELSGRIADGTVISVLAGATYVRWAVEQIRRGMAKSGRTRHDVPVFALSSISEDYAAARAAIRPVLAFYLATMGPKNQLTGVLGWNDKLAEFLEGGVEHLAAQMPEEWLDELAIAGDPESVTKSVRRLLEAGATNVVLTPVNPETAQDELRLAARTVLPEVR